MLGRRRRGDGAKGPNPARMLPGPGRNRYVIVWAILGVIIVVTGVAVVIKLSGIVSPSHSADTAQTQVNPTPIPPQTPPESANIPSSRPDEAGLKADFAKLQSNTDATIGLAIAPAGHGTTAVVLGTWTAGPAWSTMKVPLVIAALRQRDQHDVTEAMRAAITKSDNAAAESIWERLGDPVTAAHTVEKVLNEAGDLTTKVESRKIRPEFTAFGQTQWSLADQIRFAAFAACDGRDASVRALMSQIDEDQRWGLGAIPDTQFKGGWGPSEAGSYLVRQFGFVTNRSSGAVSVVAVAVQPTSGSFADGTADLNKIADWLNAHITTLPAGQCSR
jgi:hypothetical protein